jgi:hypothetical protein
MQMLGMESQVPSHPACSQVAIFTELSQLQKAVKLNNNLEVSCRLEVSLNVDLNITSLRRFIDTSCFLLAWFISHIKVVATQFDKQ